MKFISQPNFSFYNPQISILQLEIKPLQIWQIQNYRSRMSQPTQSFQLTESDKIRDLKEMVLDVEDSIVDFHPSSDSEKNEIESVDDAEKL